MIRFYSLTPDEIKDMTVREVFEGMENRVRIQAEEAEVQFFLINGAMNGSKEFLESLRISKMDKKQRKKFNKTKQDLGKLGIKVKAG